MKTKSRLKARVGQVPIEVKPEWDLIVGHWYLCRVGRSSTLVVLRFDGRSSDRETLMFIPSAGEDRVEIGASIDVLLIADYGTEEP